MVSGAPNKTTTKALSVKQLVAGQVVVVVAADDAVGMAQALQVVHRRRGQTDKMSCSKNAAESRTCNRLDQSKQAINQPANTCMDEMGTTYVLALTIMKTACLLIGIKVNERR